MNRELVLLKLGGSAITDKTRESSARLEVIRRIARETKRAKEANPELSLLLGHGSGSFGHYAAKRHGFGERGNWRAYAETGAAAARLNRIVTDIFLEEEVPVVSISPSASAQCRDGVLEKLAVASIETGLAHGLIPLVYGDVAFDSTRDMTIVSTEMLFAYLTPLLNPKRVIVAGIVEGVFGSDPHLDANAQLIRQITPRDWAQIESRLGGSHGVDVTGGMLSKVRIMLALVEHSPGVTVQITSALQDGLIERVLGDPDLEVGTRICSEKEPGAA